MTSLRKVLQDRARALARPIDVADDTSMLEVLEFVLAGAPFGVSLGYVRVVQPLDHLAPLPGTPARIAGVVNVRGELLAVLDARGLLGLSESGIANFNKVVVLSHGEMTFGVLVDAVIGVRRIDEAALCAPTRRLLGVNDSGLAVIDARALLSDETLIVNEQVTSGREQ